MIIDAPENIRKRLSSLLSQEFTASNTIGKVIMFGNVLDM